MKWLLIGGAVFLLLLTLGVLASCRQKRSAETPVVREQQVIGMGGEVIGTLSALRARKLEDARRSTGAPTMPPRPADLDTRLPHEEWVRFAQAWERDGYDSKELWRLFEAIDDSIRTELDAIDPEHYWYERLDPARRNFFVSNYAELNLMWDGMYMYFENPSGATAGFLPQAYRAMGSEELAIVFETINSTFPGGGPARHQEPRLIQLDAMTESDMSGWDAPFDRYCEIQSAHSDTGNNTFRFGIPYIYANREAFFRVD